MPCVTITLVKPQERSHRLLSMKQCHKDVQRLVLQTCCFTCKFSWTAVSCMQSPHLLESLAPKVTSLSQADPKTLGNSKVCLHYSLASHKLDMQQSSRPHPATQSIGRCSSDLPSTCKVKKGRHSGHCLGQGSPIPCPDAAKNHPSSAGIC